MQIDADWHMPQKYSHCASRRALTHALHSEVRACKEQRALCFFLQSFVVTVKLTIVSVSRRFLKTKHCQNHEQDTWPEEFSKGKDLGELWKRLVPEKSAEP